MKTENVIQAVSSAFPRMSELREHPEQMNPFDYESDDYLVEVKIRRKDYDPWIIEEMKVDTNISIAEGAKKDFLYVNCFPPIIYIWNICIINIPSVLTHPIYPSVCQIMNKDKSDNLERIQTQIEMIRSESRILTYRIDRMTEQRKALQAEKRRLKELLSTYSV